MKHLYKFRLFTFALVLITVSCSKDDGNQRTDYFPLTAESDFSFRYDLFEDMEFINEGTFKMTQGISSEKSDGLTYYPVSFDYGGTTFLGSFENLEMTRDGSKIYAIGIVNNQYLDFGLGLSFPIPIDEKLTILDRSASTDDVLENRNKTIDLSEENPENPPVLVNSAFTTTVLAPEGSITFENTGTTYTDILNTKTSIEVEMIYPLPEASYLVSVPLGPISTQISITIPAQDLLILEKVELLYSYLSFANGIGMVRDNTKVTPSNIQLETSFTVDAVINNSNTVIVADFEARELSSPDYPGVTFGFDEIDPSLNQIADFLEETQADIDNGAGYHETINELTSHSLMP